MPPITFEDSQPRPQGVRLGDLKPRDTYLPYPCSPLSQVAEAQRHTADGHTLIRWLYSGAGGLRDSDEIVYPVAVKMVRVPEQNIILDEPWDALAKITAERDELSGLLATARADRSEAWQRLSDAECDAKFAKDEFDRELEKAKDDRDKAKAEVKKLQGELTAVTHERNISLKSKEDWILWHSKLCSERNALRDELANMTDTGSVAAFLDRI